MTEKSANDKPNAFAAPYVVVFTPDQGREYGGTDITGPFATPEDAQDYLDHAEVTRDWTATIVKLDLAPPFDDEGICITTAAAAA